MASKSTRKKVAFNFEQRKMENLENWNSRIIIEIEKKEIQKCRNPKNQESRNQEIEGNLEIKKLMEI